MKPENVEINDLEKIEDTMCTENWWICKCFVDGIPLIAENEET